MSRCIALILAIAACGCTHHQLRFNTVKQAQTVADVHTQQVLDNLAKFVHNPDALPHYSFPNAGSSNVNDRVAGDTGFRFDPFGLIGWDFGLDGSRSWQEAYTMTPINDPRKLELMRCAYQRSVATCCGYGEAGHCPDCEKRFNKFYLGSEQVTKTGEQFDGKPVYLATVTLGGETELENVRVYQDRDEKNVPFYALIESGQRVTIVKESFEKSHSSPDGAGAEGRPEDLPAPKPLGEIEQPEPKELKKRLYVDGTVAEHTIRKGTITAECLFSPCWFRVGGKHDIRKGPHAELVGHYRGTYVWVPEEGRDQLTKLTITILDIAQNDPPKPAPARTKQVVAYMSAANTLTNKDHAAFIITAEIPFTDGPNTVVPEVENRRRQVFLESQLNESKDRLRAADQKLTRKLDSPEFTPNKTLLRMTWSPTDPPDLEELSRNIARALETDPRDEVQRELKAVERLIDERHETARQFRVSDTALREFAREAARPQPQRVDMLPPTRTPVPGAGYLQFEQNLRALTPPRVP